MEGTEQQMIRYDPLPSAQAFKMERDDDSGSSPITNRDQSSSSFYPEGNKLEGPAIPSLDYPFYHSVPLIFFSIFKQVHVIYLILITPFLLFKYEWVISYQMLIIQIILIIGYLSVQFISRALTFRHYKLSNQWNQKGKFWVWNFETKTWERQNEIEIKKGSVLKVEIPHAHEEGAENTRDKRIMVPVNILPIRARSKNPFVEVDDFQTLKAEMTSRVPIIDGFSYFIDSETDIIKETIAYCRIEYNFESEMGQSFEARINFNQDERVQISSQDIIHRGTFILNEISVIGIALKTFQENKINYIKKVLSGKNNIANFLRRHILFALLINTFVSWLIISMLSFITALKTTNTFYTHFHWFFFNYFSTLCFSVNSIMFLIMGFYQIIDSYLISKKFGFRMNNFVKSIDEFGVADTLLMDQFTFVGKDILKVRKFRVNADSGYSHFTEERILMVIEKSKKIHSKFPKQWLSLMNYYRKKYGIEKTKIFDSIQIRSQVIDISESIRIIAVFRGKHYIIRFNDKIKQSMFESVSFEKNSSFFDEIEKERTQGDLLLIVDILRLAEGEMDMSISINNEDFSFLALILQKIESQSEAVEFITGLKNKFNIIIMTSDPIEYFEKIMSLSGLTTNSNEQILYFDENCAETFQKELRQKFYEFERENPGVQNQPSEYQSLRHSDPTKEEKDLIVAFDSSLIGYLAVKSTRYLLTQISKRCKYIIIYNCTQFQKELCAANMFKIFPEHIFLSNFEVDQSIYKMANLSISIIDHSGTHLATAAVESYGDLSYFLSTQCVKSIGITVMIIKNSIFKNECLIWSLFTALGVVYQGKYYIIGMEYSTYIFFIFNIGFTIIPLIYYLSFRPKLIENTVVQELKYHKLRYQHLKGTFTGVFTTVITYCIIPEMEMSNIFFVILVNNTFLANFHYLSLDDTRSKTIQTFVIIAQCLISIGIYFITLYVDVQHNLFYFQLDIYPIGPTKAFLYSLTFIFNLIINFLILYFLSFLRSIVGKDMRAVREEKARQEIDKELDKQQYIVGRIGKSSGMQMRFRFNDTKTRNIQSHFVD